MRLKLTKLTMLAATMALLGCGPTDAAATCADGEMNGAETDIDCGGPSCGKCFDGNQCSLESDCLSGRCTAGRCYSQLPSGGGGGATGGGTGGGATGGGSGGGATGGGTGGGTTGGGTGGGMTGGGTGGGTTGGGSGGGTGGGTTGGGAGGGSAPNDTLVINQVQTRGDGGGNDEFVELHNPGNTPVTFDSTWAIAFRSATGTCSTNTESDRYTGAGQIVPAHGYLLLANSGFSGSVAPDGFYSLGLVDSGSLVLRRSGVTVDALCFQFDTATLGALTTCSPAFVCEGTPPLNSHDNTTASNQETGLLRRGDSPDNSADFSVSPSNPRNRFSSVGTP